MWLLEIWTDKSKILWKKIESEISTENYEVADKYCLVALHDIFANSAELAKAKFGRRRIICALGLKDPQRARDAFRNMPDCGKNDNLTRYLLFKASLLDWDSDLGRSCIDHLANHPDRQRSQDMLYACIREAQAFGDKLCTLAALKAVALTWDPARLPGACLTSVLRCSTRLVGLIEEDQKREEQMPGPSESLAEDACKLFETGELLGPKAMTMGLTGQSRKVGKAEHEGQRWERGHRHARAALVPEERVQYWRDEVRRQRVGSTAYCPSTKQLS